MTQSLQHQHPLKQAFTADGYPWLLAQAYAAIGLGTSGDKMKLYRTGLKQGRDWLEWRDPAHNNSKRICYTQSGIMAIAARLGTEKALEFARLVSQHRATNDNPGAIAVAQPQAITPVNTTYRMARVADSGELQPLPPQVQPLQASGWHVSADEQGAMATVQQPQGATVQGWQGLRVGMPDRVGGNVIINQGTIHYHAPSSGNTPRLTLTPEAWQKGAMALLFLGVFTPLVFLFAMVWGAVLPHNINVRLEAPNHAPLSY